MKGYHTLFILSTLKNSQLLASTKHLMMDYEKIMEIYELLMEELEQTTEQNSAVLKCREQCLERTRRGVKELENYISRHAPKNQEEEIIYFKTVFPLFYGELFFQAEYFNLEKNLLACSKECIGRR
jgi:hypothetical protein